MHSDKNGITEEETAMDMRFDHLYKSKFKSKSKIHLNFLHLD
jgi:hypothetical protein